MDYITLDGKYIFTDEKDYFDFVLNLDTKEVIRIKNASCTATTEKMAYSYFNSKNIKIFFNSNNPDIDFARIPKKYRKFFWSYVQNNTALVKN